MKNKFSHANLCLRPKVCRYRKGMVNKMAYKIGIIGSGMIAKQHIDNIRKDGRGEVIWICNTTEAVLERKKEEFQIPKGTTNYKDILADSEVDAVIIATPPFNHGAIMKDALQAEKHILIEKPVCINEKELSEILEEAKKHPQLVVLECSCRHSVLQPKFRFIKKMIAEGKIGEVYYIHHNAVTRQNRCGIEYPVAPWFLDKRKAGGGILIDWGEYDLAFHLGMLPQEPEMVSLDCFTRNELDQVPFDAPVFDVEEHAVAFMKFDNGLRYYYERSSNAHNEQPHETRIYGTKGGIKVSYCSWESDEIEYFYVTDDGKGKAVSEKITIDYSEHAGDGEELMIHFFDCLEKKTEPCMPLELAAKHARILFAILNSDQ